MAQYKGFYINQQWFEDIDNYIQDNRKIEKNFRFGMDAMVMMYAYTTLSNAQSRSLGPNDPRSKNIAAAWKIPVRRITGEYFEGWYAERQGLGTWVVGNHSREAYFIEYGINHPHTGLTDQRGNKIRVRRPILKLSVLQAVRSAQARRMVSNVMSTILRGQYGTFHSPGLVGIGVSNPAATRSYPIGGDLMDMMKGLAG